MGNVENPNPNIQKQWGRCALCPSRMELKDLIDHLVEKHGVSPADLTIEVSDGSQ